MPSKLDVRHRNGWSAWADTTITWVTLAVIRRNICTRAVEISISHSRMQKSATSQGADLDRDGLRQVAGLVDVVAAGLRHHVVHLQWIVDRPESVDTAGIRQVVGVGAQRVVALRAMTIVIAPRAWISRMLEQQLGQLASAGAFGDGIVMITGRPSIS